MNKALTHTINSRLTLTFCQTTTARISRAKNAWLVHARPRDIALIQDGGKVYLLTIIKQLR